MDKAISCAKVSVIIATFNEEKNIDKCLKSLMDQSYKRIEIILVDDCSQDKTVNIAEKLNKQNKLNMRILALNKHNERGVIRNLGAKVSKGQYLFFLDADMALSPDVISECVSTIKSLPDSFKALIIPEESIGEGFWTKCRILEKRCYVGDNYIEAARFFHKGSFWKVNGWDKTMISGEDWDLTRRIKKHYKVGRISSLIYHNEHKLSLLNAARKKFYYASKSLSYLKKNPANIRNIILFIIRPAYLRNWKLLFSDPLHSLGMLILKSTEFIAGLAGLAYGVFLSQF